MITCFNCKRGNVTLINMRDEHRSKTGVYICADCKVLIGNKLPKNFTLVKQKL